MSDIGAPTAESATADPPEETTGSEQAGKGSGLYPPHRTGRSTRMIGEVVVDLGSGAGFPGLVLTILGVRGVELIEADARKCAFLREVARIAAASVVIRNARIEAVPPRIADVVTARGCAPLDRLLQLAQPFIGPATVCLFLKGEQAAQELTAASQAWTMDATCHDSRSDPRGVILCLKRVARREPGGDR